MKKTLALLLTLAMVFSMVLPVGAFGFETVETVAEELPAAVQSEPEAAALAAAVVPGKNIFTGTTDPLTFDDETQADRFSPSDNLTKSIANAPVSNFDSTKNIDAGKTHGNMLAFHRNANPGRHWSGMSTSYTFDGTRTYWFTWDDYVDMQGMKEAWMVLMDFGGSGKHWDIGIGAANNKWRHVSAQNVPKCSVLNFWGKFSNVDLVNDQSNPTVPMDWYMDNLGIYPYYQISYAMPDGTTVLDEFLFPKDTEWKVENIATSYTPKAELLPAPFTKDGKLYNAIGWALTDGAAAPAESVALNNADITLFPVYEVTEILTTDAYAVTFNGTANITAKEAVTWTYEVGRTGATVATTDTTAVVTAGTTPGAVKLTAEMSDGTLVDIEILVLGTSAWKPGLNMLTGTMAPFTLENVPADVAKTVLPGIVVQDNANKAGINTSNREFYLTGGSYPRINLPFSPKMSTERPLLIEYDYYGSFDCHWLMINGSDAKDIYMNMPSKTDAWKHVRVPKALSSATNKYAEIYQLGIQIGNADGCKIHLDNYRVIPYYQVTYMNFDDTVAKTEYILMDDSGNFLTTYTPDVSVVSGALAYSLTKGGTPVNTVKLANEDIVLYPLNALSGPIVYTDGVNNKEVSPDYAQDYTVPAPADLGLEVENFICWTTPDGMLFYAGDVVTVANIENIKGKTLTAYCQDLTKPAMGFTYEGTQTVGTSKYNYSEVIEDEGRSVAHFHMYANSFEKGSWKNDARYNLTKNDGFDASEYNIVQYSYKIGTGISTTDTGNKDCAPESLYEVANPGVTVYCYYDKGVFYGAGGTMAIGNAAAQSLINDKKYHTVELDMSLAEHQSPSRAWTGGVNGKLYGFAVDMNRVNYHADTYLDYFRVYRDGVFTVNYDTNAPLGYEDFVQAEVAPDTGRGGGTGYMLKGDRPEITGLTFRGWATKPNATVEDVVDSINLTGDTTVYAVWSDILVSPKIDKSNINIRSGADNVNGIRFSSSVTLRNKAMLEEYGFIIAREDVLGSNELTFMFKKKDANKPLYAYGAAYDKKHGLDIQYDVNGSNIIFTAVCTNIPAEHYATKLVARTYAKYTVNGNAFTVYGDSVVKSIKEVAQSIRDAGGTAYEDNKDYIDSILA